MELGICLPNFTTSCTWDGLRRMVQTGERCGFATAFVSDHLVLVDELQSRYDNSRTGEFPLPSTAPFYEPLAVLAMLAAATDTIRLGTSVIILPYRNPVFTAKFFSSLDQLSGGRLILGVGSGWMAEEFDALNVPYRRRGRMSDEWLEVFRTCFTDAAPEFHGQTYDFGPVRFEPKPVQRPLPIWVGGHATPALRRTARYGTGWHATYRKHEELVALRAQLAEACAAEGRSIDDLTLSVRGPLTIGPEPRGRFRGPAEHLVDSLQALAAAGYHQYVWDLRPGDAEAACSLIDQVGAEVIPHLGVG